MVYSIYTQTKPNNKLCNLNLALHLQKKMIKNLVYTFILDLKKKTFI